MNPTQKQFSLNGAAFKKQIPISPIKKRGRGRPVTVGDVRVNLFISPWDRENVALTIARARRQAFPTRLSLSYIFREGARQMVLSLNRQMDAAEKGELPTKRRK